MSAPTTTYESQYPSGVYPGNLQLESRLDDPTTIADARAYNKHDVEIKRIQEILGPITGGALPSGSFHERLNEIEEGLGLTAHDYVGPLHNGLGDGIPIGSDVDGNTTVGTHTSDADIHHKGGETLPFHSDAADDNYLFAKWFLDWMGIWDLVNTDGVVSIIEMVKAIWQNKYDVEIPLDPKFFYPTDADGANPYFVYTAPADVDIYCGEGTGVLPLKAIGGACNLNVRPYPLYTVQNHGDGSYFHGRNTIPSGTVLRFNTDPVLTPPSGEYKVGVFGNTPFTWIAQPSGYIPDPPAGLDPTPPTGLPDPIPPPPPGGGLPPWNPWDPIDVPWDDPIRLDPNRPKQGGEPGGDIVEADKILIDPGFDVLYDGKKVAIIPPDVVSHMPQPFDGGLGGATYTQVSGQTDYGLRLDQIASMANIMAYPGWTNVYAILTAGDDPGQSSHDLHGFVREFPLNDGGKYDYPAETDWNLAEVSIGGDDVQVIVVATLYNPGDDVKMFRVTLSDEGGAPGTIWVMGFFTRKRASLLQDYMGS
jgi:hypothetical protein